MSRGPTGQKAPAYQFYPRDFDGDTRCLTNEETGAYIRFLNAAHFAEPRGSIEFSLARWAMFWSLELNKAYQIIQAFRDNGICHVFVTRDAASCKSDGQSDAEVTLGDAQIMLVNKRMSRECKSNQAHRLRSKKYRDNHKESDSVTQSGRNSDADRDAIVTLHSSSSPSTTLNKRLKYQSIRAETEDGETTQESHPPPADVPKHIEAQAFNLFGGAHAGFLNRWCGTYGPAMVQSALDKAALLDPDKGRKAPYVEGILRGLVKDGWKSEDSEGNGKPDQEQKPTGATGWETGEEVRPTR